MRNAVLIVHVAWGATGLLLGPRALWALLRGRRRTGVARSYHAAVAFVCASALALVAFDWRGLWWFVPIALASYAFVFVADRAALREDREWRRVGVRGVGGSYIALWTAVVVVSAGSAPVLWVVPTAVGAPILEWMVHRIDRRHDGARPDVARARS